jgi:transmembrane sensor
MPFPEITDKAKDEAITWVLRLRSESCSSEDRRGFNDWLAQNSEHQELYARIDSQWKALDRFKGLDFPVRQEALRYRLPYRKFEKRRAGLALAASLLLALGLTAFSPDGWYGTDTRFSTAHGNHDTINLADGSRLELNSDTEVQVHLSRWQRSVELQRGEAFFSVVHESGRPFVVTAANGRIVDIGTEFEVYLQAEKVLVAVQEGSVRVDATESRKLTANQLLAYNRKGDFLTVTAENVENLTAWRRGQLIFDNRRLDEVLAELGRYHNTQVRLSSPALGKLKVSGSFRIDRLASALDTIASTLPVTIQHPSADVVLLRNR